MPEGRVPEGVQFLHRSPLLLHPGEVFEVVDGLSVGVPEFLEVVGGGAQQETLEIDVALEVGVFPTFFREFGQAGPV